jgi:hypothetical protein
MSLHQMKIYLIQSGGTGPVKIGLTTNPAKRVAQLQTGNPMPLKLVAQIAGDRSVEGHLHRAFGRFHLTGEWFNPAPEIFAAFEAAREWPSAPVTLPPVTNSGIEFLRGFLQTEKPSELYPDGSRHRETDWDEIAELVERSPWA